MPRLLLERRYWERIKDAKRRLGAGVLTSYHAMGHLQFIDYWPDIPATLPEKMVFAWLVEHNINFYFSWYFGDLSITPDKSEHYRPDFYLPDYRIIIEVYGIYWHSRAGQYEYDFQRNFWLTATGYKVYPILDIEIMADVDAAIRDNIPLLSDPQLHGSLHAVGDRPFQPNAAIAARMRRYPRQFTARYRRPDEYRQRTEVIHSYGVQQGPRKPRPEIGPIFLGFGEEVSERIQDYGSAYSRYQWLLTIWKELENNWTGSPSQQRRLNWLTGEFSKVEETLTKEIF